VLLAACFAVLWGTLFPILSDWVQGHKISVGPPFFNKVMIPIGLFLIFLTGVGPLLAWRNTSFASIRRNLIIPAAAGVLTMVALLVGGIRPWIATSHFFALMAFSLGALVITAIGSEFFRGGRVLQSKLDTNLFGGVYHLMRRNTRRYGGYIVHFGVVVIVIGLAGSAFNLEKEQEMGLGDKLQIGSYTLVGQKYTSDDNPRYQSDAAILDIYKNGKFLGTLYPEQRNYHAGSEQRDTMVANRSTLQEDLYVILAGINRRTDRPVIKAYVNPLVAWIWIGWLVVVAGTGMALVPNAAQIKSPVSVAVAAVSLGDKTMEPVGASK